MNTHPFATPDPNAINDMSVLKVSKKWNPLEWLQKSFQKTVLIQKMNNPFGYFVMLTGAFVMAYVIALLPMKLSMLLVAGLAAIPVVIFCFAN